MTYVSPTANERMAGEIVLAMVRFAQAQLPSARPVRPSDRSNEVEQFMFHPSNKQLDRAKAVLELVQLPKPVFVVPALPKGTMAVWCAGDFSNAQRERVDRELTNQVSAISETIDREDGVEEPRILLATDLDEIIFGWSALREWAATYGVLLGWNIRARLDATRADYQMILTDGCGRWSYPPSKDL